MRIIFKHLKAFGAFLICLIVFSEIGFNFYIRHFNQNIPLPTYQIVDSNNKFWGNYDNHFGTWHKPNSTYLHNKSCFVVQYAANSLGMRDVERVKRSDSPRAAVLGDSFVEGWGIPLGDRVTDRLEERLDKEFLNFATSGSFGTVQQWMQYKRLIKSFDHDVVMIGILPYNDFQDNDAAGASPKERRPYLRGTYPDLELFYSSDALYKRTPVWRPLRDFDFTLREWSSLYRVMRFMGSYRIVDFELQPRWIASFKKRADKNAVRSAFYSYRQQDWDVIRFCLEQIMQEAEGRPVVVFSIGTHEDFVEREKRGGEKAPLTMRFEELSRDLGFLYCDMLEEMADRNLAAEDVFFVCDNHWSVEGNRIAADMLEPYAERAFEAAAKR